MGDITTQQIFGLKRAAADDDGDGVHVPLMALDPALERASLQSSTEPPSSDADSDLWSQEAPDDATLDSWATLGFTAETCAAFAVLSALIWCCWQWACCDRVKSAAGQVRSW